MKQKELKKIMKTSVESHMPDQIKIDWDYVEAERAKEKIIVQERKSLFTPFKLGLSAVLTFVIAFFVFAFLQDPVTPPAPMSGELLFESQKNVLSNSFVSTASLISIQTTQLNQSSNQFVAISVSPFESLKPYLRMVENLITQESGFTTQFLRDFEFPYETGIEITSFDVLGNPQVYQLFYNVISYEEEEDEVSFEFEGIMIFQNVTYQIEGSKENESNESVIEILAYIDEFNYIESSYEIESDESKYITSIYENGILVSEIEFEIEFDDDNEIEIKMSIKKNGTESYYELEYFQEDGQNWIEANYELIIPNSEDIEGELLILVRVDEITLETYYQVTISSGDESITVEEKRRGNDDDDEDEDDEDDEDDDDEDEEDEIDEEDEEDEDDEEDEEDGEDEEDEEV